MKRRKGEVMILKGFVLFFPEEGNTCTVIMLLQPL